MKNLNMLEEIRTKKELVDYFKSLGKNITEEEIENLKKSYELTELKNDTLTMQQLDDVAGGLHLEFHKILTDHDQYVRPYEQSKGNTTSSFHTCTVINRCHLPLIKAIAYFDHKKEISFDNYTTNPVEAARGLTPEVFFEKYATLAPLTIEAVSMSISRINAKKLAECETDLEFFYHIIEVSHKFPQIRLTFSQIKNANIASKKPEGSPLFPPTSYETLLPLFYPTVPLQPQPQGGFSNVQLRVPTYLLPKIYELAAKLEKEHPGSTWISTSSGLPANKRPHEDSLSEGEQHDTETPPVSDIDLLTKKIDSGNSASSNPESLAPSSSEPPANKRPHMDLPSKEPDSREFHSYSSHHEDRRRHHSRHHHKH